jgi:hypothetical protein
MRAKRATKQNRKSATEIRKISRRSRDPGL